MSDGAVIGHDGAASWPGANGFARAWAAAIAGTGRVTLTPEEIDALLLGFSVTLTEALLDGADGQERAHLVGARLVEANFAAPEALGTTVAMLNDQLLARLDLPAATYRRRLDRLVQALVTGYAGALRDRTLAEQEAIRRTAFAARNRIEARLRASEDLRRHPTHHDPLTGLPNRVLFMEWLGELFAAAPPGRRLAVCAVNLDRFDLLNDSLGQQVGDDLLVATARRLGRLAQAHGYRLARLGSDEFGLIVEDTNGNAAASQIAEGIFDVLREPVQLDGHRVTITASAGIVEEAIDATDPTEMARAARMSLHWAKLDGRARWVLYDPERSARYVARYTLSAEMPGALSRGEFSLVYQPLVGLADGAARGAEALARWRHPVHGVIGPDGFIDLAEDTGLIVPLGMRLLEEACVQAVGWPRIGAQAPFVSVNLAVRQLRDPGLVEQIRSVLARTGLAAERLQLEITESAVIGTDDGTIGTLHDLADLGIRLAIDDFGTGYANLAYLRTLPVHGLKIDGAFVRSLKHPGADPTGEAILATMVSLAHTLGLSVTAEGVETAEQARALAALGCDVGQGWHLGAPDGPQRIADVFGDWDATGWDLTGAG